MTVVKVAIVGSDEKHWAPQQKIRAILEIRNIIHKYAEGHDYREGAWWNPSGVIIISGGCPMGGIDIWVEMVADIFHIKKEIYPAEVNRWEDQCVCVNGNKSIQTKLIGYKSRNIQIAEACDILYCIDPKSRKWSGGRWTMKYAKKLGKEVHLVEIE